MRSKKSLEEINKNSLSVRVFGKVNHSGLLRIQAVLQVNPLDLIGKEYEILAFYNFSKTHLINNSIGFGAMMAKNGKLVFFMPLNSRVGILFCERSFCGSSELFYADQTNETITKRLNEAIVQIEYGFGNGFLFGRNKKDLEESVKLYRNIKDGHK